MKNASQVIKVGHYWSRSLVLTVLLALACVAPAQAINFDDITKGINKIDQLLGAISAPLESIAPPTTTAQSPAAATSPAKNESWWDKTLGGLETGWEKNAGAQGYESFKKKPGFYKDATMLNQLGRVARKLVPVIERQDLTYRFQILDTDEVNAFAMPGGYVYVTKGLMKQISGDDELAGVVAHELGHIVKKHGVRQAEKQGIMMAVVAAMAIKDETRKYAAIAGVAAYFANLKFSRDDEFEADAKAVKYTVNAGFNPNGLITFFNKINKDGSATKVTKYFSTHPPTNERIAKVQQQIAQYQRNGQTYAQTPTTVPTTTAGGSYSGTGTVPNQGGNGTSYSGTGQPTTNGNLQAAYNRYILARQNYEKLLAAQAPYDQLMKAFNEYQAAQKAYLALKNGTR